MLNIIINTDYLKSWNGIFKLLQVVLGAICIGIIVNNYNPTLDSLREKETYFLIATSSYFIGTSIILICCLISPLTAAILPKTILERLYNIFATIMILSASLSLILDISLTNTKLNNHDFLLAASICGLINSILYIFSICISFMTKWIK
ncbi:hypothetical protein PUN28_015006 [Cardiocondyla obscurior]|uniref:MARVEL domain-containing protein n=1 Tax=Cardiocondyla obscurior TaxID=286306 RepID=A0AAW2EY77_9HYME